MSESVTYTFTYAFSVGVTSSELGFSFYGETVMALMQQNQANNNTKKQ